MLEERNKSLMVVAKNKDSKEYIHINSLINKGYQPQLECLCCGSDIVAKLGTGGKAKHFAHTSGTYPNINNYQKKLIESRNKTVHNRAQEIIATLNKIKIPRLLDYKEIKKLTELKDLDGNIHKREFTDTVKNYIEVKINFSEKEKFFTNYIPDIYAEVEEITNELKEKNFNLAIEIFKTHDIDKEKADKYRKDKVYSIEIDFSHISQYEIEDNFDLDQQIMDTLMNIKYYKQIYFPIDKTNQDYILKFKMENEEYLKIINEKIVIKKEKNILWAWDKENKEFVLYQNATKKDYECLCCNGVLLFNGKHFKHNKVNNCEIFEQNKYADYWYNQTLFLYRLINKHRMIKTTEELCLEFKQIKINQFKNKKERTIVFKSKNSSEEESFSIIANFTDTIEISQYDDSINLEDYRKYSLDNLETYPFENKLILKSQEIHNKIENDKRKQKENDRIKILRGKEKEVFNRNIYFLNEKDELINKREIKKIHKCIFCKSELENFKHNNISNCIVFREEKINNLRERYKYEINCNKIKTINDLKGYVLNINNTSAKIEKKLNIEYKYIEYCDNKNIKLIYPDLILNFESFKKNPNNGIDLSFTLNDQIFEFNLIGTENNNFYVGKFNVIEMSFENFNKVYCLIENHQYNDFLLNLFSHSKQTDFTDEFIKKCNEIVSNEIGIHLDEKIIQLENERREKENKLILMKQQEKQKEKDQREKIWEESEKRKEDTRKYMNNFRENQNKQKEEKEMLVKINSNKENKENKIKNLIVKFLKKPLIDINYKIKLDSNNELEYFVADNYLFMNYYYECNEAKDFPKEIIYLCRLANKEEYVKLYKNHSKAIIFEAKDLFLENFILSEEQVILTSLFVSFKENKEEIKRLYQNKKFRLT